ncbi:MAG: two-component system sensor histidine kinase CreC [Desulfobacteraceae bacterium]|nr:two-component system sensor histidine kinase CreC [Desulfobacteraceae bacterium]
MKFGIRILLCYFIIVGVCFYYPMTSVLDNLRTRYLEGVEDPLVDYANILSVMAGKQLAVGSFDAQVWYQVFEGAYGRTLNAAIYKLEKKNVDLRVYITDKSGVIIFDSEDRGSIGKDYSRWLDVSMTLKGEYGARTTQKDPDDPTSSVLYVAAPIMYDQTIQGVLTVAKPTTNINNFLEQAKPKISRNVAVASGIAILLGLMASVWLTRPIKNLTQYARDINEGKRVAFPKLDQTEIGDMGAAFEKMQEALEGKKYVEHYVQSLTHEIKSPLSAIKGAAELLQEDMPKDKRAKFMENIRSETHRIQSVINRMLELAALENQKDLKKMEPVSFDVLIRTALESKEPLLAKKSIQAQAEIPEQVKISGDSFLIYQVVSNLIQNAIDFSPDKGMIKLKCQVGQKHLRFIVRDQGTGIPGYAKNRVFDKFFSLERPDTGKKSTGLGLNFVKAVAILHQGYIRLENRKDSGAKATLVLPI